MGFSQLVSLSATDVENGLMSKMIVYNRVKEQLQNFHLDMGSTLKAMETHNAIISGSVALAVLFPSPPPFVPGDIDFYVPSTSCVEFTRFLTTSFAYVQIAMGDVKLEELEAAYYASWDAIKGVRWYEHPSGTKINLIETSSPSAMEAIPRFYTTLLMNVITPDGVGCAYPDLTLERVGVFNDVSSPSLDVSFRVGMDALAAKYERRGFHILGIWTHEDVQTILQGHLCYQDRRCPLAKRGLRSNLGFLWMTFPERRGADLSVSLPDLWWVLGSAGVCQVGGESVSRHLLKVW